MHRHTSSSDVSSTNSSRNDTSERRKCSNGLTRFFLKRNKKNSDAERMFIPADTTLNCRITDSEGNNDWHHISPFYSETLRSVSSERYYQDRGDIAEFNRQASVPQLSVTDNSWPAGSSTQHSSSPLRLSSNIFKPLVINTEDGETAGSGLDYVTLYSSQPDKELPEERLARIRSVFDEKTRILNLIRDDITNLEEFIFQYEIERSTHFSSFVEYLTENGRQRLDAEIGRLEEELDRLRKECPKVVPPRVPPMKHMKWVCLRCTSCNQKLDYRCKSCGLPSTEFDPVEVSDCICGYCVESVDS